MIVKMEKIRIVGSKLILMPVLEFLQEQGIVHFEEKPARGRRKNHFPLAQKLTVEKLTKQTRTRLESLLEKVTQALRQLPVSEWTGDRTAALLPSEWDPDSIQKVEERLVSLTARIERLVSKRKAYEDDLSILSKYQRVLKVLYPMISRIKERGDLEYTGLVVHDHGQGVIQNLEKAVERLTSHRYEIFYEKVDPETTAALLVMQKEDMKKARDVLLEENIGRLRLPSSISEKPLSEAIRIILRKQRELPARIGKVEGEIREISKRWYRALDALRRSLEDKIDQIRISSSFYETKKTFLIFGWIPVRRYHSFEAHLRKKFGEKVLLERLPVTRSDRHFIPVTLQNPAWVRPYEVFTRLLPLPHYGTVDPTPFIATFFPLFFGMIIGDVGYGLVILLISLFLGRRFQERPLVRDMARIFSMGAVSCILWGVAFGEFFGSLGEPYGFHPLLFNRMEDFIPTLILALGLGAAHILLGIFLGIYTAIRQRERMEIVSKVSGLGLVLGILVVLGAVFEIAPSWGLSAGILMSAIGFVVLMVAGGRGGVMELHNLVNILSYLRLMGIGVASVALAFAANTLGGLAKNFILGILIAVFLHLVNIAFALISPTIQSLRLHYVEFFENFFKAGGTEYRPFRRTT